MDNMKNLDGDVVLKPFRFQTSSPEAAQQRQRRCTHVFPHPRLEGVKNCTLSARYTGRLCNVLVKHILRRPARLENSFIDKAVESAWPQCYLCTDSDISTDVPYSATDSDSDSGSASKHHFPAVSKQEPIYNPPIDPRETEDEANRRQLLIVHRNLGHPSNRLLQQILRDVEAPQCYPNRRDTEVPYL